MKQTILLLIALLALTTPNLQAQGPLEKTMRSFFAAVDANDFDKAVQYLSPDIQVYMPFSPTALNQEAYRGIAMAFRAAFPDLEHRITETVEAGNTLGFTARFIGTNKAPLMGNPPTGNKVDLPFNGFVKFDAKGKIAVLHSQFDVAGFNAQLTASNPMANKQMALESMAALNNRDLPGVVRNCAPTAQFHGWAPQTIDANGYQQAMSALLAAFPDAKFAVLDVTAEGNNVVVRHQLEGTHTGAAFQGIAATGKRVIVPATVTFTYRNNQAVELWLNADFLGLLSQLGAMGEASAGSKN